MNLLEALRIALDGLVTNRLRAALTTLGIIIGVGAVIGLVSLGRGVENFIAAEFQALGSNILFVFSSAPASSTRTTIEPLTTRQGEALANPAVAPSIRAVAMEYNLPAMVTAGANGSRLIVTGVTPNYVDVRGWYPRDGAFISDQDVDSAARVVVLGTTVVERLFGDKSLNPIRQTVLINQRVFTIIGVMEEQGGGAGFIGDQNEVIYIPISTAQTRLARARARDGGYEVDVFNIQAQSEAHMQDATLEIETYLSDAHGITFQGEQDFTIINQQDLLASLGQVTGILTVFLSLIAAISLLVGGIGIMNIMLVSVTERTREIGLRKAVGAQKRDILLQFLTEATTLSLVGGGIGIALSVSGALAVSAALPELAVTVQPSSVLFATLISLMIGVFFGIYPANRAAALNPIDALRYE